MKKLTLLISFILLAGITFGQTQVLKKNFELKKGIATLYFTGTTPVISFNHGETTITATTADLLTIAGADLDLGPNDLSANEAGLNTLALTPGDTTVTAVLGIIVFKTADSTLYVCRSITANKKWYTVF